MAKDRQQISFRGQRVWRMRHSDIRCPNCRRRMNDVWRIDRVGRGVEQARRECPHCGYSEPSG